MQMNSFTGKQLLALARGSDYAHAGEQEAIDLALRNIPKRTDLRLLDVGCGRGGTANYVQEQGWGKVVGLDVEPESIARARRVFPTIDFYACDVVDAAERIPGKFNVIYLFNAFYAFPDQPRDLAVLRQLAADGGRLVIFDYTDRGSYAANPLMCEGQPFIPHPLRLSSLKEMLAVAGWRLIDIRDVTTEYDRWYSDLLQHIDGKQAEITGAVGTAGFDFVRAQYVNLLSAIRDGRLGGAIVEATTAPVKS